MVVCRCSVIAEAPSVSDRDLTWCFGVRAAGLAIGAFKARKGARRGPSLIGASIGASRAGMQKRRPKLCPSRATMTCADDVADTGGLPLNRSEPNRSAYLKWITATSACQVKFRCEQARPARAGHPLKNIAHSSKLSGQVNRSVTCCPPSRKSAASIGVPSTTARVICSLRRRITRR